MSKSPSLFPFIKGEVLMFFTLVKETRGVLSFFFLTKEARGILPLPFLIKRS
jgi:hypothetical protein